MLELLQPVAFTSHLSHIAATVNANVGAGANSLLSISLLPSAVPSFRNIGIGERYTSSLVGSEAKPCCSKRFGVYI